MKIRHSILLIGSLVLMLCGVGCSDVSELPETISDIQAATRAVSTTDYYYYNGTKIGINKAPNKKFVLYNASDEQIVTQSAGALKLVEQPREVTLSSKIKRMSQKAASASLLKWAIIEDAGLTRASNKVPEILYEAPFFLTENGEELGLSHLFYVKLNNDKDVLKLTELATLNKVEVIGNNEYMPLWYTLACTKESAGNALELANKFYETGLFAACQPDLMSDDRPTCVNDPQFNNQWNLRNTGQSGGAVGVDVNFCNARSVTTGNQSIIVAVLDQGIQLNHPDLNVHSISYDTESGTSPSKIFGTHGTNCAGFISAKTNNGTGIASLAPNCPSMSISNSLIGAPDSRQKRADGINFAWRNGASVISNSWVSAVQYPVINDAISNALSNGRSGKGCVVVFSSGNENSSTVGYPANCNPDILAVGSNNRNGARSSFSNYGTALDIVAPGEQVCSTTTGSGYVTSIDGTSFSCPTVAAVAALVLSVNPNLTQKEVANIIEKTARKIGSYTYSTTSGRPNGTWNNQMGYGMLDAFAAVSAASGNQAVYFNDRTVSYSQTVAGWQIFTQNVTVTSNATLTFNPVQEFTINPPFTVDHGSQLIVSY